MLARSAIDTFPGIRPADAPGFLMAQVVDGLAATFFFRWLVPVRLRQAEKRADNPSFPTSNLSVFQFLDPIYNATCPVALRTLVMRRTSNRGK
jgi:hypothetical protein